MNNSGKKFFYCYQHGLGSSALERFNQEVDTMQNNNNYHSQQSLVQVYTRSSKNWRRERKSNFTLSMQA